MNKKAAQLNVERQMADLEQSMTNTTRHERKIIRRALEIFSANLEFLPPDPTKTRQMQHNHNSILDSSLTSSQWRESSDRQRVHYILLLKLALNEESGGPSA